MIVAQTRAYCNECAVSHDAEIRRRDDAIVGIVRCPGGDRDYPISSDADLYLRLRARSPVDPARPAPDGLRYLLNYVSITNACNFHCAICGANARANTDEAVFLPVAEICRRAEAARRAGARLLHLIGGEPTLHPRLLEVVERLSGMGLSVGLVTNGYLMGCDASLAGALKRSGLSRVCMQFDSFSEEILAKYARNCLAEKRRALRHIADAGLRLGLNATVTPHNLPELDRLLAHGLAECPTVVNMTFASAAPVGRYRMDGVGFADRESMVKALLGAGDRFRFGLDDFLPLISYRPWGLDVHPDCGVHIVFVRTPRGIFPLNRIFDLPKVYRRLHEIGATASHPTKRAAPFFVTAGAIRPGRRPEALGLAAGLLFRRRGYSMVNVGVSHYRGALFLDEQRLARCASAFHTSVGPVRGCLHYFADAKHPGSREYEFAHGGC